jgi:hypothetical protein
MPNLNAATGFNEASRQSPIELLGGFAFVANTKRPKVIMAKMNWFN